MSRRAVDLLTDGDTAKGKGGGEMAHDVIPLGAVPSGESSAEVGENGYAEVAFLQCTRYIELLRHTVGREPGGHGFESGTQMRTSILTSTSSSSTRPREQRRARLRHPL